MTRQAFIFDVDGTIVDSKALTEECYRQALGLAGMDQSVPVWGRTAEEWGCPPAVHRRKMSIFAEHAHELNPGWAHPMMCEALLRGHHVELLTGASQETMDVLLATPVLRRLAPSIVPISTGVTSEAKEYILNEMATRFDVVHYFDDLMPEDALVGRSNLHLHKPSRYNVHIASVVLAAGRGERFRAVGETVPKPLLQFGGRELLNYALGSAREVSANPIVISTEEIIAHMACDAEFAVPVRITQRGPVASAELAGAFIREDQPVVFMDSDVVLAPGSLYELTREADAIMNVLVAKRGDRAGAYGGLSGIHVVEGSTDVETCLVGAYYFGSWSDFKERAAHARIDKPHGELKFTDLMRNGPFRRVTIPTESWIPLGSPSEFYTAQAL